MDARNCISVTTLVQCVALSLFCCEVVQGVALSIPVRSNAAYHHCGPLPTIRSEQSLPFVVSTALRARLLHGSQYRWERAAPRGTKGRSRPSLWLRHRLADGPSRFIHPPTRLLAPEGTIPS